MSLPPSPSRVSADGEFGGEPPGNTDEGKDDEGATAATFNFTAFEELTERVMGESESLSVLEGLRIRWREKYGYSASGTSSATVGAIMEATTPPLRTIGCGLESSTPTLTPPTRVLQELLPEVTPLSCFHARQT
ncbi:hypothetical protein Salat_2605100 [Sesamum alatum]|uniref:Uncharacterized protein n=1 Tax=Sesamum alatum TaxID=300844 RepID=A0AAE2CAI0_9LAMI|nr:hypothetical protein Salat_2605100 [Sesamum alatum]